ncbi:hypothetical protein [Lacipirellula sp.]|uniref:hypothetical protein n=1 Tax=Lacipirellula sp. TaxID=2691419 RepID=UPI003D0CEADA
MLKSIRYALAAICLAASVGCLGLWWRSYTANVRFIGPSYFTASPAQMLEAFDGRCIVTYARSKLPYHHWERLPEGSDDRLQSLKRYMDKRKMFGPVGSGFYFPLWYPALVFALAAVAAIRIVRQFTLRSALVGMSVVAALLGMVVAL